MSGEIRVDELILESIRSMNTLGENMKLSSDKTNNLLEKILNRRGMISAPLIFVYPDAGAVGSVDAGTLTLNYEVGGITSVAGVSSSMDYSLDSQGQEYIRSLSIWVDKPVIIDLDSKLKYPVKAGRRFNLSFQQFKTLKITTTETTNIFVVASTNSTSLIVETQTEIKKAVETVDVWAEIAQAGIREGATVDISANYQTTLYIDCCLSSEIAHTGTEIIVQISSALSGDSYWSDLVRFTGPVGTPVKADVLVAGSVGATVIEVTDPTTKELDHLKKFIFIENTVDITHSEIAYLVAQSDATDDITIQDGLTYAQETSADIFSVDGAVASVVGMYPVVIPRSAYRVRVLYNNNYDSNGATVHTRCRLSKVTGL